MKPARDPRTAHDAPFAGKLARALAVLAALGIAASCGWRPAESSPLDQAPRVAAPALPISSPAEYADRPISAEAGGEYFLRAGAGDPYAAGMAYPVLLALMEAYPEVLGRDWNGFAARFGFVSDPDAKGDPRVPPVGFHLTTDPATRVPWVVTNCQMCHAERLRLPAGDVVVAGLGNKRVRPHAYANALLRIGADPSLDAARVEALATKRAEEWGVPWDVPMRRPIVKATLEGLSALAVRAAARSARFESALPGRVATIESFAMALDPYRPAPIPFPDVIGWTKIPDVVGFPYRETFSYDASGYGSPQALVLEASFVFGTRPDWYKTHPHIATSMYLYLRSFRRALRYPRATDAALVARGGERFAAVCARCHGTYQAREGHGPKVLYAESVIATSLVGTDTARADAVTQEFVDASNEFPLTQGLTRVRATHGYVPPVLIDVWARGLYGHAGQWPSLEVLAMKPDDRPRRFVVDTEGMYDLDRVGVRYDVPRSDRPLRPGEYAYDGRTPGLGVEGHPFLSTLPADDRRAVIEYLKTL